MEDKESLEYARARKVGQIRAYKFTRGYLDKQIAIEEKELQAIEDSLNKK